jgi:YD repeat-containing protein
MNRLMKKIIIVIWVSIGNLTILYGQNINDLQKLNLKGKIESIVDSGYYAIENELDKVHHIEFDKVGNRISQIYYRIKDNDSIVHQYKYNKRNQIIEEVLLNSRIVQNVYKYNYDSINQIKRKQFDSNNNLEAVFVSVLNPNGNIVIEYIYNSENQLEEIDTFIYDDDRMLIKEVSYDPIDSLSSYLIYQNDKRGNPVKESCLLPDSVILWYSLEKYDSNDNVIEHNQYNSFGELKTNSTYSYVYDFQGNWILCKFIKNGEVKYIRKRTLKYY